MFTKTLVATIALVALVSCADAKYYNVVSWAHWGDRCGSNFASECAGMVDAPIATWLQLVGDYIEILDFKSFYSQKYDTYSDCWCRTTIYYRTDNATYIQENYGYPPGSQNATLVNDGLTLLPSLTMIAVANMLWFIH